MSVAVTSIPLTRRLEPIVAPLPKDCHSSDSPVRYSTVKLSILCPFWIASSIDTTLNVVGSLNDTNKEDVPSPLSGAQNVSSLPSRTFIGE